jgi:hypothetical protein
MRRIAYLLTLLLAPALFAGSEVALSRAIPHRAAFDQSAPRMASDGTTFLVGWSDGRADAAGVPVYVVRLGSEGQLLDRAPLPIRASSRNDRVLRQSPLITWTGNVYIVGWSEIPSDNIGARAFCYVRVTRDGEVLDAQPRIIPNIETPWDIAGANGRTVLLYTGNFPNTILFGQFLFADGEALGPRVVFPEPAHAWSGRVATNGSSFYVTWTSYGGSSDRVMGARVSLDGALGTPRILETGARGGNLVASDGAQYLAAYGDASFNIVTEKIDADGASLARTTLAQRVPTNHPGLAALAPFADGYVLATATRDGSFGGILLDDEGKPTSTTLPLAARSDWGFSMDIESNAQHTLLTWNDPAEDSITGTDIFTDVLDFEPERELISPSAPRQSHLRFATSGNGFLAAWVEDRTSSELRVARVTANGAPLDGEGIVVADQIEGAPALTFDGRNYVLAWSTGRRDDNGSRENCGARLMRISPAGALLDGPGGRVITTDCTASVGIASNGQESLLAWSSAAADPVQLTEKPILNAARVTLDGVIEETHRLPSRDLRALDLSIAWNRDTWLIAWMRYFDFEDCTLCNPPAPPDSNIDALRLNRNLGLLDVEPITLAETGRDRAPSVASNGVDFLVVWEEAPIGAEHSRVLARRITRQGAVQQTQTVDRGSEPHIAVRGSEYVITYEDGGDLYYKIHDTSQIVAYGLQRDREHGPRILTVGNNFVVAYLRLAREPQYNFVDRAFLRILGGGAPRGRAVRK